MKDQRKTKKQLIEELAALRREIKTLKRGGRRAKQSPLGEALRQRVAITEAMGDGLILFAMDGSVLDVNPAYEKMTGLRKKDVVARQGAEVAQKTVAPKELDKIAAAFRKSLSGKPIPPIETVMVDQKGRETHVYFTTTFLQDESGEPASILSVIKNISPLAESERALQESEEKYRILVEQSPLGIIFLELESRKITFANPAIQQITGYSAEELARLSPKKWMQLIHDEDHQVMAQRVKRILTGKKSSPKAQYRLIRKDGSVRWVETNSAPITYQGRAAIQIVIADITEQKRAEEESRRREYLYRAVVEDQTELICRFRPDGTLTFVNSAYCRYFNKRQEDLIGKRFWPRIIKEDREQVRENLAHLSRHTPVQTHEQRVLSPEGEIRWQQWTNRAIFDDRGRLIEYQSVGRDITERKSLEEHRRQSEEQFRTLAEQSPNMIFINCRGRIVYVNQASVDIMGYGRKEFYAPDFRYLSLMIPADRTRARRNFQSRMQSKNFPTQEYTLVTKSGRHLETLLNSTLISYQGHDCILGIITDITERKRAERELREYKNRLERMVADRTAELEASQARARAQYKGVPVPTYTWQRKGRDFELIDYNDAAEKITGGKIKKYIGTLASQLYKDDPLIRKDLRRCYREKTAFDRQMLYHMRSIGQDKYFHVKYAYTPPDLILVHTEDITQRRRDEEEIRKFKTISDRAAYGTAISDLDGRLLYVNEAFARMHGYGADDVIGKHLSALHTREQLKRVDQLNRRLKRDGSYTAQEVWHKRKDGTVFPTLMSAAIIKDEKGKPEFLSATAVDITERKQVQEEIRRQKDHLDEVFNNVQEGIGIVDEKEQIIFCNPAFGRIFEQDPRRLMGRSLYDLFSPEASKIIRQENRKRRKGKVSVYELPLVTAKGTRKHLLVTASPRYDEKGTYRGAFGAILDITERKRDEETLRESTERLQILFEFAPEAYYLTDTRGRFVDGNRAAEEMSGYDREELIGRTVIEANLLIREEISKAIKILEANRRGKSTGPVQFTIRKKDGRFLILEISSYPVTIKGELLILNIARDITEHKALDQKIQESEERFRTTFEQVAVGMTHVALDGHFLRVNRKFCDIVGYSRPEILKRRFQDITHPADLPTNMDLTRQLLDGEIDQLTVEKRYIHRDGYPVWVHLTATLIRDSSGQPDYFICVVEDIGVRKWAEEELKRSEERLKILFDYAPDGYFSLDAHGQVLDCNRAAEELTGYRKKELSGKSILKFGLALKEELPKWAVFLEELTHGRSLGPQEFSLVRKGGKRIFAELSAFPVKIDSQIRILLIIHDITKRKQNEQELTESEQRYKTLFASSASGILIAKLKTNRIKYSNPAARNMFGYTEQEFLTKRISDLHPKTAQKRVMAGFEEQMLGIKTLNPTVPCLRKDGSVFYADINTARTVIDGEECAVGFFTDITERKQARQKLQESEETLRALMNSTEDSAILVDIHGQILALNEAAARRFGRPMEELVGIDGWALIPAELARTRKRMMRQAVQTKKLVRFQDRRGDIFFDTTMYPVIDAKGKVTRVAVYGRDITVEVRAKEALQESEEKHREFLQLLPTPVFEMDLKGTITTTNLAGLVLFGYRQEDIDGGLSVWDLFLPEEKSRAQENIAKRLRGEDFEDHEYTARRKDGTTFPVIIISGAILRDGKPVGLRGVVVDITERRNLENTLRESEEKFRGIAENMPEIVFTTDADGRITYISPAAEDILGYSPEDIVGKLHHALLKSSEVPVAINHFRRVIKGKPVTSLQLDMKRRDRTIVSTELSATPVRTHGKITGTQGIIRDITERVRADREIERAGEKYRNMVNLVPDAIITVDMKGTVTSCNQAFLKQYGLAEDDVLDKPFWDSPVMNPERREEYKKLFQNLLRGKPPKPFELEWVDRRGRTCCIEIRCRFIKEDRKRTGLQAVIRDVTEEHEMRTDLEQSEEQLRKLVETAPDAIYILDTEGRITFCNTMALEFGDHRRKSELVGKKFTDLNSVRKVNIGKLRKLFAAVIKGERLPLSEFPFHRKDGTIRWGEVRHSLLQEDGKMVGMMIVIRDITQRKREEEVQRALNRISDAVHTSKDLKQLYRIIHRQLSDFLKSKNISICLYDREKHLLTIEYHHDEKDRFEGCVPAGKSLTAYLMKQNKPLLLTAKRIRQLKRSGTVKPLGAATKVWMGVPLRIEGKTIGALVVNDYRSEQAFDQQDLQFLELVSDTIALSIEYKQAEAELLESEELFRTLAEQSPYIIFVSHMGKTIYANKKWERVFGYKRKELYAPDFDFFTLLAPEERTRIRRKMGLHRQGKNVPPYRCAHVTKRGKRIELHCIVRLIRIHGKRAVLGIMREIE